MSTVVRKTVNFTINDKPFTAPEGTMILDAAKRADIFISNLCSNPKLKPFAACRTCMVEVNEDGKKNLVYSCTHPVSEGMKIRTDTEETTRYNGACLEMLLVEHPLDCPICDKSGVCPLQDNTDHLKLWNGRFEIKRRNEPSIKTNPIIEFYLNRCIMCGMCVRVCDEIQGVQALDYNKRGYQVGIGTANHEPLDCEFCGQCITVCPTGALMDMTSSARGLASMFKNTHSTCNFCSWGCTVKMETKKGQLVRIEGDETFDLGINEGNLCAKGRFGHGMVHNKQRIQRPLMNVGGTFQEVSWSEALETIADRLKSTINRSGPASIAAMGGEKLTNEENYLFQKLFRGLVGSNQLTNLNQLRAPYVNRFTQQCFENGIVSKPITELDEADVVLLFNTDIPSEYPVAGNSIRKAAINFGTDILIANPRDVVFHHESRVEVRMTYKPGADLAVANRISKILIDKNLVDTGKVKTVLPNYDQFVQSLSKYTADYAQNATGLDDATLTRAAERFSRNADRFILIGNDIHETGQGEAILNALLNLSILVHAGGQGSVSIYPPREHCNSQGVNDMGLTPEYLPGYRRVDDPEALAHLAKTWGLNELKFKGENLVDNLWEHCAKGHVKMLYIAGEDPCHSYYKADVVKNALQTVPFLVVHDSYMTETAKMADLILPSCTYAEKEGTFTNMTRHVQKVAPAVLPEGESRPDFDIFLDLADAFGKPFDFNSVEDVQAEIEIAAPIYKGLFPGKKSKQWTPAESGHKPGFAVTEAEAAPATNGNGYPFTLISNNHMFHIGTYTQYAKALMDIGPDCIAEINPKDAKELGVESGDRIRVESSTHTVEVPVEVSKRSVQGVIYIPKNWVDVPINKMRNGEEGLVSVKISKAG
ncbi:molybdopterin-dependent oxidoreductase [Nitrospina gracilis]|uniref:molybdopterin-dependent oxidoreductase n=1 Tax=Nitrospina gracilis TaxID=35801 RepID=UPI001F22BBCD|nr:molybdopterin-dependent oxidoreductase [Nitrospina gracilis]MCF8720417.1 formate dehydrogenase alpha subunit [Nitrospina gracilis Nb-211]